MSRDHMMGWTGHQMFQEHADEKKKHVTPAPKRFSTEEQKFRAALDDTGPIKDTTLIVGTYSGTYISASNLDACTITLPRDDGFDAAAYAFKFMKTHGGINPCAEISKYGKARQDKLKLQEHIEQIRQKRLKA